MKISKLQAYYHLAPPHHSTAPSQPSEARLLGPPNLEYSLDIGIQGTSMGDVPILVIRVVGIAGADGGGEFLGGETMF